MRRSFRFAFSHVLFFCFFCGVAAGTVGANLLGHEMLKGWAGELFSGSLTGKAADPELLGLAGMLDRDQRRQLCRYVFRQRLREFGLAVLVGMTPLSALGFAAAAFAGGLGGGFLLAMATLQQGIGGILVFLRILLPQWLFYMPAWILLALKAEDGLEQMKLRLWPLLTAAVLAGVFLEAYINPVLWRF